jgi:GTPase
MATKKAVHLSEFLPRVMVLGVEAPYNKSEDLQSYYDEFLSLVRTNGVHYNHAMFIKIREITPGYFLTKGKLEEVRQACEQEKIDHLIISESLTAQQERNLTDFLGVKVFDRTHLILEIFEKAAVSAEGKTQVEIAMLQYKKSRLAGKGVHMGQQRGGTGMRAGFGETAKERETRDIETQILKLGAQLEKIQSARSTQRKSRLTNKVPHVCLIGYTNAGKSTILNALTKSSVLAEDKLFATLDTTTRELFIDGIKKGLISDTVGFIQNLPPNLIAAFKSTLDELRYANLLLQVVDLGNSNWESHIRVVKEILDDLEINKDMLYIFNKVDKVTNIEALQERLDRYQPHVLTHANDKTGLLPLLNFLNSWSPSAQN